jgi:hypothetical protein
MAEMADLTIVTERRGFQPYGTAKAEREKEVVRGLIDHLDEDMKEARIGIDRDKRSIMLLRDTFGV